MMEGWHKYYCPLRPPDIGAVPSRPVRVEHVSCVAHGRECYGAVYYDRRLSAVEVDAYELLEEEEHEDKDMLSDMLTATFVCWAKQRGIEYGVDIPVMLLGLYNLQTGKLVEEESK